MEKGTGGLLALGFQRIPAEGLLLVDFFHLHLEDVGDQFRLDALDALQR